MSPDIIFGDGPQYVLVDCCFERKWRVVRFEEKLIFLEDTTLFLFGGL